MGKGHTVVYGDDDEFEWNSAKAETNKTRTRIISARVARKTEALEYALGDVL